MEDKRIKLSHVLAEIDQYERNGELHHFSVHYCKTNGQKGFKPRVRKSGSKVTTVSESTSTKFRYNVKKNGVLMLVDDTNNQPFALKICLLTHYNGIRIQH